MTLKRAEKSALFFLECSVGFLLCSSLLQGATTGETISNTATASYLVDGVQQESHSNTVAFDVAGHEPTITLLRPKENGSLMEPLSTSSYLRNDGEFYPIAEPTDSGGTLLNRRTPIAMSETDIYGLNDLVIMYIQDPDHNQDSQIRDVLELHITSSSGDEETIRILETGVNSGEFSGYIPLTSLHLVQGDGRLYVQTGDEITVMYADTSYAKKIRSARIQGNENLKLWIEKEVNKAVASRGEVVQYTLKVHNDEAQTLQHIVIDDALPLGLKYKEGSARLGLSRIIPRFLEDGRHLYFDIEKLASQSVEKITFLAEIGAGNLPKEIVNTATVGLLGDRSRSNTAMAKTQIKEELMRSHGIILGEVSTCAQSTPHKRQGIPGVTLYMENGTYVVTDQSGKYHIEGVLAGTHVIQVDEASLPDGYQIGTDSSSPRFLGRNASQFVDMGKGALKRINFCLERQTAQIKRQQKQKGDDAYHYHIPTAVSKMPEYGAEALYEFEGKTEILWPPEHYVPQTPSTKIAVVHAKSQRAEVWLNDQKVSMLNFEGKTTEPDSDIVIDRYKGVDLLGNTNTIRVKLFDPSGRLIQILSRKVHVSSRAAKIEFVPENSYLIADGKHAPVLAIRFVDENGYPLRSGITGTFSIEAPYLSQEALALSKENPLALSTIQSRYTIHSEGIAYIKLQPTTRAGQVSLHFSLQDRDEVLKAWLKPKLREWIMVGFAQGSVGYNTLRGHQESLDAQGLKEKVITQGRVSFFAKGRIKGSWLLTMAYDSGKEKDEGRFFDTIDPNTYYTLYHDGSIQNYEAPSRKKLFLKIEKEHFSLLFGDISTDMSSTELSTYNRTMMGIKGEYHQEHVETKAFIAKTEQLFMRDEIRGDGTSGYYHLTHQPLIAHSEKISIEVRDRYRPERIIQSRQLQRFKDYEIDYARGTLFFKEPIYSTDASFNPRYVIASYEIEGGQGEHYTYGGRVRAKAFKDTLSVGGSYVMQDSGTSQRQLLGVDTRVKLGAHTTMRAEYAMSKDSEDGNSTTANATFAEVEHVSNGLYARAYYREQESGFGLDQLNTNLEGTRKMGIDVTKMFDNRLSLVNKLYRDSNLRTQKDQDVLETRAQIDKTLWSAYLGYRYANHTDSQSIHQMLLGASYALFDQRLKLHVSHDQSFGKDENILFPTKTLAGVDYAISAKTNVFGTYEWAKGAEVKHQIGRVGMRYQPWTGMKVENTTMSEFSNDTTRLYNTLGFLQNYQYGEHWSFNAGYENGSIMEGNVTEENFGFDAYRAGVSYRDEGWTAMFNAEYRDADNGRKYNLNTGVYNQLNEAFAFALSGMYRKQDENNTLEERGNIRLSIAYRPWQEGLIFLDKLDLVHHQKHNDEEDFRTQKIINNANFNYMPTPKLECALQHGIKYVSEGAESYEHEGLTQLFGIDTHYDIAPKWEMGLQGSMLYAHSAKSMDYSAGFYTGYNLFENMVLRAGYNWSGFEDRDFSLQTYRMEGPYLQFRMKFDQKDLKQMVRMLSW